MMARRMLKAPLLDFCLSPASPSIHPSHFRRAVEISQREVASLTTIIFCILTLGLALPILGVLSRCAPSLSSSSRPLGLKAAASHCGRVGPTTLWSMTTASNLSRTDSAGSPLWHRFTALTVERTMLEVPQVRAPLACPQLWHRLAAISFEEKTPSTLRLPHVPVFARRLL